MSYNIPTKTGLDVAAAVKRTFGDESGVQLVDNDIVNWINQAQVHIASSTRVLKTKATTSLISGQNTYSLAEALDFCEEVGDEAIARVIYSDICTKTEIR